MILTRHHQKKPQDPVLQFQANGKVEPVPNSELTSRIGIKIIDIKPGVMLCHLISLMSCQPLELRVVDAATKKGVVKVPPTVKSDVSLCSLLF